MSFFILNIMSEYFLKKPECDKFCKFFVFQNIVEKAVDNPFIR